MPDVPLLSQDTALGAFLEKFTEDLDAGCVGPVEHYIALWPHHADLIGRQYAKLADLHDSPGTGPVWSTPDWRRDFASGYVPSDAGFPVIGPYRILSELGRGGQGVVHLALDTRLGRRVALKVLSAGSRFDASALDRFRREAAITSKLDHPGICPVYDTGMDGDSAWIAMRHIEGENLARLLARAAAENDAGDLAATPVTEREPGSWRSRGPVTRTEVHRVLKLFEKAARALHAAHESGVVHRDVKPGNVMVSADDDPVILDFGLASSEDPEWVTLTRPGEVVGTPAYMSPEQVSGSTHLDRRTDIWSLGVTLFHALTLRRPFEGSTREDVNAAIRNRLIPDARRLNPAIPRDLKIVLETAMAKEPTLRYQTALDLAEDLRRIRVFEPILAHPAPFGLRLLRWSRRHPARAALITFVAVIVPLLVALVGYLAAELPHIRAAGAAELREQVERALERGYLELAEDSPTLAALTFDEVLAECPDSVEALAGRAFSMLRMGEGPAAVALLTGAGGQTSGHTGLRRVLADVLRRNGSVEEAERLLASVPEPEDDLALFMAGLVDLDPGPFDDPKALRRAADHFTRAILTSSRARPLYYFELAWVAGLLADRDLALKVAEALRRRWPDSWLAWYRVGHALQDIDPPQAIAAFRRSLSLHSGHAFVHHDLGVTLSKSGDPASAISEFREALRLRPRASVTWDALGLSLDALGDQAGATSAYEKALSLNAGATDTLVNLGVARQRAGDLEGAMVLYRRALALRPDHSLAHYNLGSALKESGDPGAAAVACREAIRLRPDLADAHNGLGSALHAMGDYEGAVVAFREALRLRPGDLRYASNLGTVLLASGDPAAAARAYRDAIAARPDLPDAYKGLGDSLKKSRLLVEAEAAYREAIRRKPDYAMALCNLGNTLRQQGRFREALDVMRRGHEAAALLPEWTQPSALWVSECEALVACDERLAKIECGSAPWPEPKDLPAMAGIATLTGRHLLAARFWEEHLASAGPRGSGAVLERFNAACAAALAAAKAQAGAAGSADGSPEHWRRRATEWLEAELATCRHRLENGRSREDSLIAVLRSWRSAPELTGLRDPAALAAMPSSERKRCEVFWASVDDLIDEIGL